MLTHSKTWCYLLNYIWNSLFALRKGRYCPPLGANVCIAHRSMTSPVAQRLKRLPTMWETWVQSLGQEDPLEKEMATHSSILAWRIPQMEEGAWGATVHSIVKSQTRLKQLSIHTYRHLRNEILVNIPLQTPHFGGFLSQTH